jgi:hypothetical protein
MPKDNGFPHLSDLQTRVTNKLHGAGDVKINVLFRLIKRRWPEPHESNRHQQQVIGATITRTNRKLRERGLRIAPGERRGTYRLTKI